jgi:plasmid stabilization system protein ParE
MEPYEVIMAAHAIEDLRGIAHYIAVEKTAPRAADKLMGEITAQVHELKTMPERYPLVIPKKLRKFGFRKFMVGNYLIFYTVTEAPDQVIIRRVLYARRNWKKVLSTELPT